MSESKPEKDESSKKVSEPVLDSSDAGETKEPDDGLGELSKEGDEAVRSSKEESSVDGIPMDQKLESLVAEFKDIPHRPQAFVKSRKTIMFLLIITIILVFAGFTVVGLYGWKAFQQLGQIDQMDTRLLALSQQVSQNKMDFSETKQSLSKQNEASVKQVQSTLESELTKAAENFRSLSAKSQQQVDMLQQRVDGHQQRLLSLSTTSREDWMLAEAEYLLKLANQRVLLERTSENAVALLDSADQLVAQVSSGTGDAELFAIRKAIGRDITALKLISTVDRDGIYLKLQALGDMVEQLPRIPNHTFVHTSEDNMDDSGVKENPESTSILSRVWYELKAMAGALDQYIKIEDATAPVKPLVDQHFTQVASLNVRLLLEQAQIALLKESPVIYNNSLTKARELIVDYYIPSSQSAEFQKSIAELAIIDVAPKLPDISHSLRLLHAYIQQLHKLETVREGQL